jgi:hypothetical protein
MRDRPAFCASADHLDHAAIGHALVGAQLDLGVGLRAAGLLQARRGQLAGCERLVVQEDLAGLVHHQGDKRGRVSRAGGVGFGQVQPDRAGQQGAVMMKITTSTSITSTSGVTLMSLMGCGPGCAQGGRKP